MIKLTLVNPPRTRIDRSEIAPPLGLMRLAQMARAIGIEVSIIDLNLLFHLDLNLSDPQTFYGTAVNRILSERPDVVGLTSMVVDSHISICLARLLKEEHPGIVTAVGGTHFSAIADETIRAFPWIDFVVTGEGETFIRDLPVFIDRNGGHSVVQGTPSSSVQDYGELPFDLIDLDLYFSVNGIRCLDFESARGCRYKCAFCYSPNHYDGFRNFGIEQTVYELNRASSLGFRNVFFVEDNFLNDSARAIDLCHALKTADLNLTWQAYATFPQLSPDIIHAMAEAGCTAVFAGIDAVGVESRRAHKKAFVRDANALVRRVQECVGAGIVPTCAFLLSPPSYVGGKDIAETLFFALKARNAGAHVRLNTLTLYNQTGSFLNSVSKPEYDNFKVRVMLDVPDVVEENYYATQYPELFPFHSRYVGPNEWHGFVSEVHVLYTLFEAFPKTVEYLWEQDNISPIAIANKLLDNTGPLLHIPKAARRDAQMLGAVEFFEELAVVKPKLQPILEMESAGFLEHSY